MVPLDAAKKLKKILRVMDRTVLEVYEAKKLLMQSDKDAWKEESDQNPNIISNLRE